MQNIVAKKQGLWDSVASGCLFAKVSVHDMSLSWRKMAQTVSKLDRPQNSNGSLRQEKQSESLGWSPGGALRLPNYGGSENRTPKRR
jgi:hypothetical protein